MRPPVRRMAFLPPFLLPLTIFIALCTGASHRSPASLSLSRGPHLVGYVAMRRSASVVGGDRLFKREETADQCGRNVCLRDGEENLSLASGIDLASRSEFSIETPAVLRAVNRAGS